MLIFEKVTEFQWVSSKALRVVDKNLSNFKPCERSLEYMIISLPGETG